MFSAHDFVMIFGGARVRRPALQPVETGATQYTENMPGSGLILGIESSCDETAAAIVERGARTVSSVVASQIATHARYGGVVPELGQPRASPRHCSRGSRRAGRGAPYARRSRCHRCDLRPRPCRSASGGHHLRQGSRLCESSSVDRRESPRGSHSRGAAERAGGTGECSEGKPFSRPRRIRGNARRKSTQVLRLVRRRRTRSG